MPLEIVKSSDQKGDKKEAQEVISTMDSQESRDYEIFLEKARKEEEKKEKALLKAAKEAEKRRRDCNMDPWTRRL